MVSLNMQVGACLACSSSVQQLRLARQTAFTRSFRRRSSSSKGCYVNRKYSQVAIWAAVVFVLVMVFGQFGGNEGSVRGTPTTYSEMLSQIQSKNIKEATIEGEKIIALTNNGTVLTANTTSLDRGLIGDLRANDVKFDIKAPARPSFLSQVFISWFPMLLLIGVWIFFMKKSQGKGGMGGMM